MSDILLKEELLQLKENNSKNFNLFFTVDITPEGDWNQGVGFITKEMI